MRSNAGARIVCLTIWLTVNQAAFSEPPAVPAGVRPSEADRAIVSAQAAIRRSGSSPKGYTQYAAACLQKARETGDVSWFVHADRLLAKSQRLAPRDLETLSILATLRLQQHRFEDAIALARKVLAQAPERDTAYGIIGDSLIELGDYDRAFDTYQTMADLKPSIAAYTRAAYARALQGDMPSAKRMLRMAADAGSPYAENTAWALVQLGHEEFATGNLDGAERAYSEALQRFPNYVHALAGLGKVASARGNVKTAIQLYERATAAIPLHDYVVALGDLYTLDGRSRDAAKQYSQVLAVAQINRASGIAPGVELAQFYCDHDRNLTEALAIARTVEHRQKDIRTEDALAWSLFKNARYSDALEASKRALRLGTLDASFLYHRARIEAGLGREAEAREHMRKALDINPYFSPKEARTARDVLRRLDAGKAVAVIDPGAVAAQNNMPIR